LKGIQAGPGRDLPKIVRGNVIDRGSPGKRSHAKVSQSKRQIIVAAFIVGAIIVSALQLFLLSQKGSEDLPLPARISITPHTPILIVQESEFDFIHGVRSGSGTSSSPYIISDWAIDATLAPGIYVIGTSAHFIIRNVTINSTAQDYDGILLDGVSNVQIQNVTIYNCDTGIEIQNVCSSIEVKESSISFSADHGIVRQFGTASFVNITQNTIYENGGTGIRLGATTYFNIASNLVSTNDTSSGGRRGIQLLQSSSGVVTGNTVSAVYNEAMSCTNSQNVVVGGNRFSSVWYYGLQLISCSGFLIYHNNFMGAWDQAYDNGGSANAWNASYPIGGNYWIDYVGEDNGPKDGIGDTPYAFNVSQMDHYPLMAEGPIEPIPEFPTVLLPITSVIALLFVVVRRSPRKEP